MIIVKSFTPRVG